MVSYGREAREKQIASATEKGEAVDEMATNTEYILKMVLELIDKCETLEELRASLNNVLGEEKTEG